jgi:hypothetical protein
MPHYIVLYPLDTGLTIIHPAPEGDPPVIVDDATLFATPSDEFTNEERATILISKGFLKLATAKQSARANDTDIQPNTTKEPA